MKDRLAFISLFIICVQIGLGVGLALAAAQDNERPAIGKKPERSNRPNIGDKKANPQPQPPNGEGSKRTRPPGNIRTSSSKTKRFNFEESVRKGSESLDNNDFEQARRYFDEADTRRKAQPKDRSITPALIDLLDTLKQVLKLHVEANALGEGDIEKKLANYEEVLRLRPSDQKAKEQLPELYRKDSEIALEKQDYKRAVERLELLLKIDPNDSKTKERLVEALLGRGDAELKAGKEAIAQTTFKRVLVLDPKNQKATAFLQTFDLRSLLAAAKSNIENRNFEAAITNLKDALSLDPNNEEVKRDLQLAEGNLQKQSAEKLYASRKYLDAEREFKQALALLPEDEEVKRRLAELSLRLGQPLPPKGKLTWRGTLDGITKLMIKGKELVFLDGEKAIDASVDTGLPDIGYTIKRTKPTSKDLLIRVVEQPTTANGYSTVLVLDAKKANNKSHSFELEWELKREGRISWRGRVSGRSLMRIQGPFIDIEQINGTAAQDVNFQVEALPHQNTIVKLRKISGKPEIRLVEPPSQANQYVATIAIESSSQAESEDLAFELNWQLK
ncbi:MAG: hypothetical protein AB1489_04560 [Acidobacteriota bacterium]